MKTNGARLGRDTKNSEKPNGLGRNLTNTTTPVGHPIPVRLDCNGIEILLNYFQAYKNIGSNIFIVPFVH